jgi:hypothetical protein
MTVTWCCGGWGLCRPVCLNARVCGVMVAGSATLVGIWVRCALGLRKCGASWLRHTRDVECVSWVRIAGAESSAVSMVLCRSIEIADLRCRVCFAEDRRWCCLMTCELLVDCRRAAALRCCAGVDVRVDVPDARGCVSTRISTVKRYHSVVMLFCMCVSRSIHSLFVDLVCCCVPSACLHVHRVAVVVL